jgi:hypothetical protein
MLLSHPFVPGRIFIGLEPTTPIPRFHIHLCHNGLAHIAWTRSVPARRAA